MPSFTYDVRAPRIVFGAGSLSRLREEIDRLGSGRVLVLCTPGRGSDLKRVSELLADSVGGVFQGARAHVPVEIVERAAEMARDVGADCYVSIGGGSATGLAKALALRDVRPIVAIPTTYAGSEVTPIWGITDGVQKTTGRNERVLPKTVIYDPALTVSLSREVTGPSALNAIAHCVEALYAPDANPVTSLVAEEGIRRMAVALPALSRDPMDLEARAIALYAAYLAGSALAAASMGLHHKLCHLLGGTFGLPHAQTHAVVLPHVLAFNATVAREAVRRIFAALQVAAPVPHGNTSEVPDAAAGLYDLAHAIGTPVALRDIGMRAADLDRAADLAAAIPVAEPRPVTRRGMRILLESAFRGDRPTLLTEDG